MCGGVAIGVGGNVPSTPRFCDLGFVLDLGLISLIIIDN